VLRDSGAVPLLGEELEHVAHPSLGAAERIPRDPESLRQRVSGLVADAVNIQGQLIGIRLHATDRLIPITLIDADGRGCADAMGVEEDLNRTDDFLLGPGFHHPGLTLEPNALQFQ
jgi:hypothetical protein